MNCAVKKTMAEATRHTITGVASRTQNTGTPSNKSRNVPPPTPVTTPSHKNPMISICLRDATSAPVTAKTADAVKSTPVNSVGATATTASKDRSISI